MSEQKQREEKPIITVIEGNFANQYWVLDQPELVIGRDDVCDIVLPDRQISRQHIRIKVQDNRFFVEDLESRNGTWINGQRLEGEQELFDGDEIHLALAIRLRFIGSGATAPLPFELPTNIGGRLRLDRESRRVFIGDEEVDPPLSLPQYRLLELLFINNGSVCTRDEVVDAVWPDVVGEGVSEQAIDALVRRLRDRLAEYDPEYQYIVTVRGHGFRLDNPSND
ncbi:MAG: FHA domain-containing protein [Chloroflexota bacterium]